MNFFSKFNGRKGDKSLFDFDDDQHYLDKGTPNQSKKGAVFDTKVEADSEKI
jgi:hypothetical protein